MTDVLIVSTLATVRAGLAALLAFDRDLRVAGQVAALDRVASGALLPEGGVVLLDAPSVEEIEEALALLDQGGPGLVVLGPGSAAGRLLLAAPPFPWALLTRGAPADRIVAAVRAVAAGLVVLEPELTVEALGRGSGGPLPLGGELDDLTGREHEVLTLVAVGLTNKAIAQRLAISDHTVKFHVASILAKLGAESRTEAVHLAARRGLLTL